MVVDGIAPRGYQEKEHHPDNQAVASPLLLLDFVESASHHHGALTDIVVGVRFEVVVVYIGQGEIRLRCRFGQGRFHAHVQRRTAPAQFDAVSVVQRRVIRSFTVYERAVAASQVVQPPAIVHEKHLRMAPAGDGVQDLDLIVAAAADEERIDKPILPGGLGIISCILDDDGRLHTHAIGWGRQFQDFRS